MSKVGVSGAGGDDQIVVVDLQIDCLHFFRRDVHGLNFGKDYFHVLAFAQHGANRRSNVGRRECGCRHLIEQRLKEMVICAVDHSDAHIFARQSFCSLEPAKPRADNDDMRF